MASDDSQSANSPMVVYFDEDGDTQLLLTRHDHKRTYVVSSKAMSLVCRAWKSMLSLNNGFREGTLVGSDRVIPLPDDDPNALALLLNIAHMHFDLIPKTLEFGTLLYVAELTEKYGVIKILRPWIKEWLRAVEHLVEKPGYEEWLFIAWVFGEEEIFDKLSLRLVMQVREDEYGQCVTPEGKVLDPSDDNALFPPDIIEDILKRRLALIGIFLDFVYEHVDKYLETATESTRYYCIHADIVDPCVAETCDTLSFGSLVLALSKIGLGPERKEASDITDSVRTIAKNLQTIMLRHLECSVAKEGHIICDHSRCTAESDIRGKTNCLNRIRPPGLPSHYNHMKQKQDELLGVHRNAGPEAGQPRQPHSEVSKKRRRQ